MLNLHVKFVFDEIKKCSSLNFKKKPSKFKNHPVCFIG